MALALFDLDNTVADRDAAFRRWTAQLIERFGLDDDEVERVVEMDHDGLVPRPMFLQQLRDEFGLAPGVDELLRWYDDAYPQCYRPMPGIADELARLRARGWCVAIVTNGSTDVQSRKLRTIGLVDVVDAVCISEEIGFRKPNPGIFAVAAQRCGTALDGWMVGDSPDADIQGGQRVGLRTVWVRRGRQWDSTGPPPDVIVDDATSAAKLLLAGEP